MNTNFSLSENCIFAKISQTALNNSEHFSCGDEDLDDFFTNNAIEYDNELMGKTYYWALRNNPRKIVAMVTLANSGIQLSHLQNSVKRKINKSIPFVKRSRSYPAVLIGRLGVNTDFQGPKFRVGSQVMEFIKKWFKSSDNKTGCRFVLVDAANNGHTIKYYERNGFKPIFQDVEKEKEFYGIDSSEDLRTRMFYYDLL
jgi:GNAT superfamily N-acetyltransferase